MTPLVSKLACLITLPHNFRLTPFLAFYNRDSRQIAEQVDTQTGCLTKGLMWHHQPARLRLNFTNPNQVNAQLETTKAFPYKTKNEFAFKVNQMLGLNQPIESFEKIHITHPELGVIIQKNTGLRVPVTATAFEALTWAIIGQQISLQAAISLRRKWIQAINQRYDHTLWCYPDALSALSLDLQQLRQIGFSYAKANTLLTVSRLVQDNGLPLAQWETAPPIDTITQALMDIRGIGAWTVNYTLLRGFGWLDGSLHQDAGMQRALYRLRGSVSKITNTETEQWLTQFTPWRALATAHLWDYYTTQANQ